MLTSKHLLAVLLALTLVSPVMARKGFFAQAQADFIEDGEIISAGPGVNSQYQQQINNILAQVSDRASAKVRDGAEDKLTQLGHNALETMKSELTKRKGSPRDALAIAIFRLENEASSPRDAIMEWARRKNGAVPATLTTQRLPADTLRSSFPHHLFLLAEAKSTTPNAALPPTLFAVASDGKVQPIGDDAALTKFLRGELGTLATKFTRRQAAAAAALLALGRDYAFDATADSDTTDADATGTAISTDKKHKVTITLTFADNRVAAIQVTKAPVTPDPKPEIPPAGGDTPAIEKSTGPTETPIPITPPATAPDDK